LPPDECTSFEVESEVEDMYIETQRGRDSRRGRQQLLEKREKEKKKWTAMLIVRH